MKDWITSGVRLAGPLLVAALMSAAPMDAARAAMCALPHEHAALSTRVVQTDLMVAALTCNERSRYNSFVKKFEAELVANGRAMREYFRRAYGARAKSEVNRFVTRLANEASARAIARGTAAYCADASSLFGEVLGLEPRQLRAFLAERPVSNHHGVQSCAVKASSAAPQ